MDLFEHQARDLFDHYGVPVLRGGVATTPEQAREAAGRIGGTVVVKAQVKTGGRGKAGGVKLAKTADDAEQIAAVLVPTARYSRSTGRSPSTTTRPSGIPRTRHWPTREPGIPWSARHTRPGSTT